MKKVHGQCCSTAISARRRQLHRLGFLQTALEAPERGSTTVTSCNSIQLGRQSGGVAHHRRGAEQPADGVFDNDRQGREHARPPALQEAQEAAGRALRRPPAECTTRVGFKTRAEMGCLLGCRCKD